MTGNLLSRADMLAVTEIIVHGTTVATNALLEHKGARVGLLTILKSGVQAPGADELRAIQQELLRGNFIAAVDTGWRFIAANMNIC